MKAQLFSDAGTQPIEDASVAWSEAKSPYRTIGTLTIPAQDAYRRRDSSISTNT